MYFTVDSALLPMKDKITIAKVNNLGIPSKHFTAEIRNNSAKAELKYLGAYCLSIDTLKPFVSLVNFKNGDNISKLTQLKFTAEDWGTGLYKYDIFIDDIWELAFIEPKSKTVSANIPSYLSAGEHTVRIVAQDVNRNTRELKATIIK